MLLIVIPNCNRGITLTICLPRCLIFVKRDNVEIQPIRKFILQSKSFDNGDDIIGYCEGRGVAIFFLRKFGSNFSIKLYLGCTFQKKKIGGIRQIPHGQFKIHR